jgi:UDP-N-acetylmuramoyl-tripeptide--D-alanyl-D-alanine ligase
MIEILFKIFQNHPSITTDTRKIVPGSIFFALKGDNFDGNKFALDALQKGASYAIIDNEYYQQDTRCILVKDCLKTLQLLATYYRRSFDIPVIAITGSNGKTTTKELISSILSSKYKTHFTKGNLNNHIGVPITLLSMPLDTEVAVIEMGANHQGEINELCIIAEPTHGLVTNIGKAHLEGFGGIEGVKKGKSELYRFLNLNNKTLFINKDEPFLEELSGVNHKKIYYTISTDLSLEEPDYQIKCIENTEFLKVAFLDEDGRVHNVCTNLSGKYNLGNISTAIAIGKYFKVPSASIVSALENYIPSNNRSQIVILNSNKIILDAYNANPSSMKVALDSLNSLENTEFKWAILGDMFELGEESTYEHKLIFEYAQKLKINKTIYVGKEFQKVIDTDATHFDNVDQLKEWFSIQNISNTTILIKGSRGMSLEKIL